MYNIQTCAWFIIHMQAYIVIIWFNSITHEQKKNSIISQHTNPQLSIPNYMYYLQIGCIFFPFVFSELVC